jgi:flagellar protein FliS
VSYSTRGANAYRQTEVQSRSPLELVVMLYDGALRFLGEASAAAARDDHRARTRAISRALAIIGELQSTLNLKDGGQVAEQLNALYAYVLSRIADSSLNHQPGTLQEAHRLLSTVRDGWAEVAQAQAAER